MQILDEKGSDPILLSSRRSGLPRKIGIGLATIVVALILIGQAIFLVQAINSGALFGTAASVPTTGSLSHRLDVVLGNALGTSDRGVRRFTVTSIRPYTPDRSLKAVTVTWAINSNLAAGSIGNGAQADVYITLRDIYTSGLPVGAVRLSGTYPVSGAHGNRESVVMRVAMNRTTASTIGRIGWDNLSAQEVWPLVDRIYVQAAFQPLTSE